VFDADVPALPLMSLGMVLVLLGRSVVLRRRVGRWQEPEVPTEPAVPPA